MTRAIGGATRGGCGPAPDAAPARAGRHRVRLAWSGTASHAGNFLRRCWLPVLAVLLLTPAFTPRDTAASFSVPRWTIAGGGSGFVETGPFFTAGTSGQTTAGTVVGPTYAIAAGFWTPGAAIVVGVGDPSEDGGPLPDDARLPRVAAVHAAAPNPLVHETSIAFDLPDTRTVEIKVFDVTGALIRTIENGVRPAGRHAIPWDVADDNGQRVGSGLYFVRVRLGNLERTQKLAVVR